MIANIYDPIIIFSTDRSSFLTATVHVNRVPQNITNSLVHKIKEIMRIFDRDTVAKACKWFWSKIEALVEADDDLVEEIHSEHFFSFIFCTLLKADVFNCAVLLFLNV